MNLLTDLSYKKRNVLAIICINRIKSDKLSQEKINDCWNLFFMLAEPRLRALAYRYRSTYKYNEILSESVIIIYKFDNWAGNTLQHLHNRLRYRLYRLLPREILITDDNVNPGVEDYHDCESIIYHPDLTEQERKLWRALDILQDYTLKEISEMMQIKASTLRSYKHRLKNKVKNLNE